MILHNGTKAAMRIIDPNIKNERITPIKPMSVNPSLNSYIKKVIITRTAVITATMKPYLAARLAFFLKVLLIYSHNLISTNLLVHFTKGAFL